MEAPNTVQYDGLVLIPRPGDQVLVIANESGINTLKDLVERAYEHRGFEQVKELDEKGTRTYQFRRSMSDGTKVCYVKIGQGTAAPRQAFDRSQRTRRHDFAEMPTTTSENKFWINFVPGFVTEHDVYESRSRERSLELSLLLEYATKHRPPFF